MCDRCREREEQDAIFWNTVRRALLMVAGAIAKRYPERTALSSPGRKIA